MTTRAVAAQGTAAPAVRVDGVRRGGGLVLVGAFDAAGPNGTAAGAPIGLVIAHGQPLARAGIHALLDREADVAVLGEAGDAEQAVALARQTRPAVLLMDIALPGLDGVPAMRRIAADPGLAGIRIVILTACESDDHVFGALRAGVSGFLLKDTGPADLIAAIRDVASGEGALSPSVARRLMDEFAALPERKHPRPERLNELTPRELEVVALVAGGKSNFEIAERLVVSPVTAKTHVSRALCKLDARDRAQRVTLAYESGLVVPRHPNVFRSHPKGASMIRRTRIGFLAATTAVSLSALAVGACGGGGSAATAPTTASGKAATVGLANEGNLGNILVDTQGRSLYLFQKDVGTKSECAGACAAAWPPLRATGKPVVGTALSASKIGTSARSDGKPQVTYNGHPLYLYSADQKPGDTNGQGLNVFGGGWFALSAAGNMVSGKGSNPGGGIGY